MCGGNRNAARLAGINHEKVGAIMMINCSVLSSLAGVVLASRMHEITPTNLQSTSTMSAITAALLGGVAFMGGIGTMKGAFIGILLLNSFKNGLDIIGVNPYWQIIANGLLLIAAIIVDYINQLSLAKKLKKVAD
jgi:ribose/xylose/arabinose/galactoside ABC-type transport system permease subunit